MFRKVLIANRGEIALRIIRACQELDIRTVAIYSEADADSLHVAYADEAYCVGPAPSSQSYLNIPNIISAALISGADAIHPGYGYLAERAHFAEICRANGLAFIGPSPETIERMGDKAAAKRTMEEAGVPVIPGSPGGVESDREAAGIAREIGYPVIVKAAAGGGGKGMRVAYDEKELLRVLAPARAESEAAFGSGVVYLEKFVTKPRHVEIQILVDSHGKAIHLGERECSLQRRHQKLLEEAPCPIMTDELRQAMGEAALKGALAVDYVNAGTVEFLLDSEGRYYFMEMNTRIQVEHPVTEMVTGVDLVREQLLVAAGEPLSYNQDDITIRGHAIECRIAAEDPYRNFLPSPGRIKTYRPPGGPGIRIDSAAYEGWNVPSYYDSMFAKVIAWAPTRDRAIDRMKVALREFTIDGIAHTIPFHLEILDDPFFRRGELSTDFIETRFLAKNAL
ncbi:MAG: acetyl-CoA carboxylase biotin carboxylase subunit [Firmicutes bacterium]|nr:acetyl-CoA carboxylase biotin carboxylase subunit [Bacillota bacterium]